MAAAVLQQQQQSRYRSLPEWLGSSHVSDPSGRFRPLPFHERSRLHDVAVVVVDDDPSVLHVIQVMLELYGLRVTTSVGA